MRRDITWRHFVASGIFAAPWAVHELGRGGTTQNSPFLQFAELSGHSVEVDVDLPLVVSTETDPKHHVVDLLRGDRSTHRFAGQGRFHSIQKRVDLVDFVTSA